MSELTVYEKPSCTTCKKLAALLDERGIAWTSVNPHAKGLTEPELRDLLRKAGVGPRDVLRAREALVRDLGLPGDRTDDDLIGLLVEHPSLLERPIVVRGDRALLARPVERALELLDA